MFRHLALPVGIILFAVIALGVMLHTAQADQTVTTAGTNSSSTLIPGGTPDPGTAPAVNADDIQGDAGY